MKLSLSTKFMRGMLAKLISRAIKKKYGYKVNICINKIDLDMYNGQTHLHTDVDLELSGEEFNKIMQSINED